MIRRLHRLPTLPRASCVAAFCLAALCLAGGCTNLEVVEQCVSEDWYERGFTDATDGLSTRQFLTYHNRCTQHGVTPHRTNYLSGWVAGRGLTDSS